MEWHDTGTTAQECCKTKWAAILPARFRPIHTADAEIELLGIRILLVQIIKMEDRIRLQKEEERRQERKSREHAMT